MAIEWRVKATEFANCNCVYACPCQFNALPTNGNCHAAGGWQIEEGHFGAVRLDGMRLTVPVVHGDTLYAYTEVIDKAEGVVHFRHWGVNQDDRVVFECERWVLVKRRSHRAAGGA